MHHRPNGPSVLYNAVPLRRVFPRIFCCIRGLFSPSSFCEERLSSAEQLPTGEWGRGQCGRPLWTAGERVWRGADSQSDVCLPTPVRMHSQTIPSHSPDRFLSHFLCAVLVCLLPQVCLKQMH